MSIRHQSTPPLGLWPSVRDNSILSTEPHNLAVLILLNALALAAFFAIVFAWGQHVGSTDDKLLRADDARHVRMLARACGTHGQIWRSPQTGNYACIYTNADGAVMVEAIPDKPYLASVR
jgi:hypothetical protein